MQICVIAKEPRPGFAKTRLCPPCSPSQAAAIAEAALTDTLAAVVRTPATRHVLALAGRPGPWLPAGFDVVPQAEGGLARRLAAAFAGCFTHEADEPVLLVGMDTPQLTPDLLLAAGDALVAARNDAVVGPAVDGGYWLIGFTREVSGAFHSVPMSTAGTFLRQLARLEALGLAVALAPVLEDVDSMDAATRVATRCAGTRFAGEVGRVLSALSIGRGRPDRARTGPTPCPGDGPTGTTRPGARTRAPAR